MSTASHVVWRSIVLTSFFILPAVALLCNAEPIMTAVGLPPVNAAAVRV